MCEGWYRKTFQADSLWKGKRVVMDFGGIIYLGDVYLNGHKIASTDYGYVGIEADLTPYLHFDKENTVAVYASTGPKKVLVGIQVADCSAMFICKFKILPI